MIRCIAQSSFEIVFVRTFITLSHIDTKFLKCLTTVGSMHVIFVYVIDKMCVVLLEMSPRGSCLEVNNELIVQDNMEK